MQAMCAAADRLASALLVSALLICGGCDRGSTQTLERVDQSVQSWSATLRETVEQWGRGDVPRVYVRQVVTAAEKALEKQARTLQDAPAAGGRREKLERSLADLRRRAHELSGAVERDDSDEARAVVFEKGGA
jgi:hypothetical protein